jgi:hypothetical protein
MVAILISVLFISMEVALIELNL